MVRHSISGKECISILCKHFGFTVARQRGSHVVLKRQGAQGDIVTVVPDHHELKIGTLKGALKLGQVDEKAFFRFL